MAKSSIGPIASYVKGSVGDVTFRNTRNGPVIQQKPVPTGDPSPAQLARRAHFAEGRRALAPAPQSFLALFGLASAAVNSNYIAVWQSAWNRVTGASSPLKLRAATIPAQPEITLITDDFSNRRFFVVLDRQTPVDDYSWLVVARYEQFDASIVWGYAPDITTDAVPNHLVVSYSDSTWLSTQAAWIIPLEANPARFGNGYLHTA